MSKEEKEELLDIAPNNETFKEAVDLLYDKSQQQKLINNEAKLLFYQENNKVAEIRLQLGKLLENGQIQCHASHDVAIIHIGDYVGNGEKRTLNLIDGVAVKEETQLIGVLSSKVKTFNEVFIGNSTITYGYPTSITRINPALDIKLPLLRKGLVAGKNNELKLIIIDCPVHHGDSGGLVLEVEDIFPTITYRTIGFTTRIILTNDLTESENSGFSVVIPMDYVLETVRDWNRKNKQNTSAGAVF